MAKKGEEVKKVVFNVTIGSSILIAEKKEFNNVE
jgi:hypothetical protein